MTRLARTQGKIFFGNLAIWQPDYKGGFAYEARQHNDSTNVSTMGDQMFSYGVSCAEMRSAKCDSLAYRAVVSYGWGLGNRREFDAAK